MRLIDADSLMSELNTDSIVGITTSIIINKQPTAYDVDKVIENLTKEIDTEINEYFDYEGATKNSHFRKAVEIAKAGFTQ